MRVRHLFGAVASSAALVSSCAEPPPPQPFQVYIHVDGDKGKPLAQAQVFRGEKQIGVTDAQGRALLTIPATLGSLEGDSVNVDVKCPEGFQSPTGSISLKLTRIVDKAKIPEASVDCPPLVRKVVVAIQADNGANLPVKYLGNVVTRTDEAGAAHFTLAVPPRNTFQVTLDAGDTNLKPQNASKVFAVEEKDELFVFPARFELPKKIYVAPPKVQVAKRIGG